MCKPTVLLFALGILGIVAGPQRCISQTQPASGTNVAALDPMLSDGPGPANNISPNTPAGAALRIDPSLLPAIAKQFAAMQAEIDALKVELKSRESATATTPAPAPEKPAVASEANAVTPEAKAIEPVTLSASRDGSQSRSGLLERPKPAEPFAYADWTWLNGNSRNKDVVWDSQFFTPEIRLDAHYVFDLNHPRDDTMGGSTEVFRSNEIQVQQISFGGNFHWQNVRARVLTMAGMFGVTTPRNDGITPAANGTPSTIPNPAAGSVVGSTSWAPGPSLSATPGYTCVSGPTGWCPDLRKDEPSFRYAIMVKF